MDSEEESVSDVVADLLTVNSVDAEKEVDSCSVMNEFVADGLVEDDLECITESEDESEGVLVGASALRLAESELVLDEEDVRVRETEVEPVLE